MHPHSHHREAGGSHRSVAGALALLGFALFLAAFPVANVLAANMGFRFNKGVCPAGPYPKGQNLVSLPFLNFYGNAQDMCFALNLQVGAGTVQQINAQTGAVFTHLCGGAAPFPLLPRVGVIVTNPVAIGGLLVGSHVPPPAPGVPLFPLGPFPIGQNLYPVPYHTFSSNAQDVCNEAGLIAGAGRVQRIDACTGAVQTHVCGAAGPFRLILGEAVFIMSQAGVTFLPRHL